MCNQGASAGCSPPPGQDPWTRPWARRPPDTPLGTPAMRPERGTGRGAGQAKRRMTRSSGLREAADCAKRWMTLRLTALRVVQLRQVTVAGYLIRPVSGLEGSAPMRRGIRPAR
jgi:hypothetical protein